MNWWQLKKQQAGFVASYILYGIGLLAAVGAAYGHLRLTSEQGRLVQETVDEVAQQLEVIKGKILLCGAVYPDGDHLQFATRHAYPAPATLGNRAAISAVTCPGPALGLAAMPDGVPLPVSPPDFNEWEYEHTLADGVRLRLTPQSTGGAAQARTRLLRQFQGTVVADGDTLVFTVLN